jgi:pimeloyl-ACP methyl ester carboxylesterase
MARVVLVHGAFNEFSGPHELKTRWLPALRDGLWHHDVEIAATDVGVCFYGDLFRLEPDTEAKRRLEHSRAGIAESLANLVGSDVIAALGQAASDAAFDRTVNMVTIMATTPDLRARMRARAEALVDEDTRVIVSHSLGTLFSYTALCNHPHWRVHTFVTLGSPLASPMIFKHLEPPAIDGKGQWPGSVERWANVRAIGDKTAAFALREKFGTRVEELLIDNGHRAHDPEPYLNAAVTGAAIAAALA